MKCSHFSFEKKKIIITLLFMTIEKDMPIQHIILGKHILGIYNLKSHFYIDQLGFAGAGIPMFLIFDQKTDYGYSLEPPRRDSSNVYPESMF